MNVNIVCIALNTDRILPRMAKMLAAGTGWTLSQTPDHNADVNYAFPYLEARHWGSDILRAGFFPHKDESPLDRVWEMQVRASILRIAMNRGMRQTLDTYGRAAHITPPLDRQHFSLGPERRSAHGLHFGVSGFVYGNGRKGEHLLAMAVSATPEIVWHGAGRGWPVRTHLIRYSDLPDWYRMLDVYVCPSQAEGGPYGPLEALACGVPVVIPRGVGLLDDLPEVPGIVRYKRGDAVDLLRAIQLVRQTLAEVDREQLRETTSAYTAEGWVTGHLAAFSPLANLDLAEALRISRAADPTPDDEVEEALGLRSIGGNLYRLPNGRIIHGRGAAEDALIAGAY